MHTFSTPYDFLMFSEGGNGWTGNEWVNTDVPQGFILGRTLYLQYNTGLPDHVFCNITICADSSSTLH